MGAGELIGTWVDNHGGTWEFNVSATVAVNSHYLGRWDTPEPGKLVVTLSNGQAIESKYEMVDGRVKMWDSLSADAKYMMLTRV